MLQAGFFQRGYEHVELQTILTELERYRGYFPYDAIERAVEERVRIVPHLLEILSEIADDPEAFADDEEYSAHIYAMFLLAQFRVKSAYPLLVKFFSHPGRLSLRLTGDIVTDDLQAMLASVSCGDDSLIKQLIENPEVNEWVRAAALRSLLVFVSVGEQTRESVVAYMRGLFRFKLKREPSYVWEMLVLCAMELYPEELYEEIQRSYEDGLIEDEFLSLAEVEAALEDGEEEMLDLLTSNPEYRLITDTIAEMEWWPCFHFEPHGPPTKQKVGRNQPCPCGSGKKYKKCCGKL